MTLKHLLIFSIICLCQMIVACDTTTEGEKSSTFKQDNINEMDWAQIVSQSKGKRITIMLDQSDPFMEDYLQDFVAPDLFKKHDIDLTFFSLDAKEMPDSLKNASKVDNHLVDIIAFKPSLYHILKNEKLLQKNVLQRLPNFEYINVDDVFKKNDQQGLKEGAKCPWGLLQQTIIYNDAEVSNRPKNLKEFGSWLKENPGKFTIPINDTGIDFIIGWILELSNDEQIFEGAFNEEKYIQASTRLWDFISRHRKYFWRNGVYFPKNMEELQQLFINNEISFALAADRMLVNKKVDLGFYPSTTKAYIFDFGGIEEPYFLGITKNSRHKAASMVVLNYLISPKAQSEKLELDVWGNGSVLDMNTLNAEQLSFFRYSKEALLKDSTKTYPRIPKPNMTYIKRLRKDFRLNILER